ncbi:hypothetical protein B0H16DRAFT_1558480 [Mycena metata]|uniref:Uncharacterized protein n=1 Tax=Mycena metata TaxID=1033252 RepID=A0AAD7IML8_9AGAR|nr:hypothetical protein B0H16DRAFT_1558480 [Mycena metata]
MLPASRYPSLASLLGRIFLVFLPHCLVLPLDLLLTTSTFRISAEWHKSGVLAIPWHLLPSFSLNINMCATTTQMDGARVLPTGFARSSPALTAMPSRETHRRSVAGPELWPTCSTGGAGQRSTSCKAPLVQCWFVVPSSYLYLQEAEKVSSITVLRTTKKIEFWIVSKPPIGLKA